MCISERYVAAVGNHRKGVRLLIEARADIDTARIDVGATPLGIETEKGYVDVACFLREAGADQNKIRTAKDMEYIGAHATTDTVMA
jgi:ankyrin repeat protein